MIGNKNEGRGRVFIFQVAKRDLFFTQNFSREIKKIKKARGDPRRSFPYE